LKVVSYSGGISTVNYHLRRGTGSILFPGWTPGPIAIAPDGTWFAIGNSQGEVTIWTGLPKVNRLATIAAHDGPVRAIAISPDSTQLATAGADKTVRIWDRATQRTLAIARVDGDLYSCSWANAGVELAVAGERGLYLFAFLT